MEAILKVLFAAHYDTSKPVGRFLNECKDKCGKTDEILDEGTVTELQDICEYANPSMHGSHTDLENAHVNSSELLIYVKKLLNVTTLSSNKLR